MNETDEIAQTAAAPGVEGTGATVEEATSRALAELGAERDEVVVEVLSRGRPAAGPR